MNAEVYKKIDMEYSSKHQEYSSRTPINTKKTHQNYSNSTKINKWYTQQYEYV